MQISRLEKEYVQKQFMDIEKHMFKTVTYFKYLRHLLTQDNDFMIEINTII